MYKKKTFDILFGSKIKVEKWGMNFITILTGFCFF